MIVRKNLSRICATLLAAVMVLGCVGPALAADAKSMTVGIYTTSDMHGKCYGLNPITGYEVKDSFLKVATAMKEERAKVDDSILIDNGDTIQGTPITSYNINVESGKENPMALCLRYIGYDAFVLGNHEFNYSMDIQGIYYDMLKDKTTKYPGTPVSVLSANYIDIATQKPKEDPYLIRTFTVDGKEFKVGVLGFENVNVPNWDLPSHYQGADFVHKDNTNRTYSFEWTNYWQKQLREVEKCDIVIVAAHEGETGFDNGNADKAPQEQLAAFIANTTGIDLVIGGHDHTATAKVLPNKDGKDVTYLNGGSNTLAKCVLTLKSDGTFSFDVPSTLKLADYQNDAGLEAITKPYYDKTLPFVSQQIGTLSGDWDNVSDYYTTQGDTYDLVHKAQLWASGADVSITTPVPNKGFALSSLIPEGAKTAPISLKDCYSFYKYDNNLLYMIEMTGKQLKDWLEHGSKQYKVEDGKAAGGNFGTDIAYGINYDIYLGNPEGSRVQNVTYQGKPLTDEQVLKVALSSYRLSANELGDEYGWYATTGITMGSPKVLWDASVSDQFGGVGGSVPLIVGEYIKAETAAGREITPVRDTQFHVYTTASDTLTRSQFVSLLYKAAGSPAVTAETSPFTDTAATDSAIVWASQKGIVSGNGKGAFLPDAPVTREQAAVMLVGYCKAMGNGPVGSWALRIPYGDLDAIAPWASSGAMWNVIAKLIPVGEDNLFRPAGTITPAEGQAMVDAATAHGK